MHLAGRDCSGDCLVNNIMKSLSLSDNMHNDDGTGHGAAKFCNRDYEKGRPR